MNDSELKSMLDACCLGKDSAWKEFMRTFHPLIRGTVRKYAGDQTEDVVQLVYEQLIRSNYQMLARFEGSFPAFLVYIQRTARNVAVAQYRSTLRRSHASVDDALDRLIDPAPAPDQIVLAQDALDLLEAGIMALRTSYKEVVLLLYNGLNHREVSEILKIPIGTVLTRASRAKEFLHRQLKMQINLKS